MEVCESIAATAEEWVGKACLKGKTRKEDAFLNYAHVIDGVAHGSNRARLHWAETSFPNGVYDPVSWMPIKYEGSALDWDRFKFNKIKPDFSTYTHAPVEAIMDAGIGPRGEACVRIAEVAIVNKIWLLEAMNGYLDQGVYYRSARVAGVSNFGYFLIAQIVDR